eukprot:scpid37745/ scgid23527/ HAUS augmin-like complex subunit 4
MLLLRFVLEISCRCVEEVISLLEQTFSQSFSLQQRCSGHFVSRSRSSKMDGVLRNVEHLLPAGKVTQTDLEANPEFSRVLSRLSTDYLSRDGTDLRTASELEKWQHELRQSRTEWLKCKLLYTEVEEVLEDSQIQSLALSSPSTDSKALETVQYGLSHAESTQYMCMPPSEHAQPQAEPMSILGIPMSEVERNASTATKAAAQQIRKHIVPVIQANLQRKLRELTAFYAPAGLPAGVALSQQVQTDAQKVRANKRLISDDSLQIEQLRMQYYDVLWRCLELLDSMLVEHKLNNSAADEHCKLLIIRCQTVALKLQLLEAQVKCDTYTAPNTAALTMVKHSLDQARSEVDAGHVASTAALSAYAGLGSGFDAIVEEYTRLQAELDNKRWALSELRHGQ